MITITPLASSSAGNSYLIDDGRTKVLIEAGLKYREIQKGVGFRMSEIAACFISHEHGDHSRSAADIMRAGIDVYASGGTLKALGLQGHRAISIQAQRQESVGTWNVLPFETQHDAAEALGFLLANQAGDKLVFLTDTYYCRYTFTGLTHVMVECNFSEAILEENIQHGRVPAVMRSRLLRSHFSLEHVKEFLLANDLSKVRSIHLLHLSDNNSDEELFKREIQEIAGCPVYVCKSRAV